MRGQQNKKIVQKGVCRSSVTTCTKLAPHIVQLLTIQWPSKHSKKYSHKNVFVFNK